MYVCWGWECYLFRNFIFLLLISIVLILLEADEFPSYFGDVIIFC